MNAMGFSAKPQSKADQNSPFLCFFSFLLKEKFLFWSSAKKKRPHKVVNNNLFFFVYANRILYIYNLY